MKVWIIICSVGFLTFLMRYLPMKSAFIQNNRFLKSQAFAILPYCILAALIGPTFLPLIRSANSALPIAVVVGGVATLLVTHKSKSITWGALAGYVSFVALDFLFHNRP